MKRLIRGRLSKCLEVDLDALPPLEHDNYFADAIQIDALESEDPCQDVLADSLDDDDIIVIADTTIA